MQTKYVEVKRTLAYVIELDQEIDFDVDDQQRIVRPIPEDVLDAEDYVNYAEAEILNEEYVALDPSTMSATDEVKPTLAYVIELDQALKDYVNYAEADPSTMSATDDTNLLALSRAVNEFVNYMGDADWVPGEDVDADSLASAVLSAAIEYVREL